MNEEQERDQISLWEKLNRLYGDKERLPGGEGLSVGEELTDKAAAEAFEVDPAGSPLPLFPAGARPASGQPVRGIPASPGNAAGRINETCALCRRSCKQTGRKLNRMLCIGFLPKED